MKGMFALVQSNGQRLGTAVVRENKTDRLVCAFLNPNGKFTITRVVPLAATEEWYFFDNATELNAFLEEEASSKEVTPESPSTSDPAEE